jgi:MFS transporter, DHA2 family, methylenomycin A resistance protein
MTSNRITSSSVVTLIAAYLGLFVGLIDANAVNLAFPAIRADLGGGISGAQWTIDAYNVAFAAVLLTSGSLGDRFGRRTLLRFGLITFVATSLACAVAPSLPLLLAARAVQGIGAGLMLPQGLAIAAHAFPNIVDRAQATAAWAIAAATSTAIGPVLGGVLTDTLGWRYIFWLNIPVGLAALLMTYRYLSESRDPDARGIDLPGQTFAIVGLATLTLVLVQGRTMALHWTLALAVVATAGIGLFFWTQRRVNNPMLPLGLLGSRQLVAALIATFAMTFGTYGMLMVNSFAFQQQRGESALATAGAFLPMPLTYLALIPVVNVVAHRTGPKLPMLTGLALLAAGMLVYAVAGATANIALLQTGFVLTGAGLAFNTAPAVGLAMSAIPLTRVGLASGVVNLARLVGITVGVASLGTVMAIDGVRAALLAGAVVELIAAVVVLRWVARRPAAVAGSKAESKEVCHA